MKFLVLLVFAVITGHTNADTNSQFKVHEWGTFTSLVGSNGIRQEGMFHEDEALPNFVHNFGEHPSGFVAESRALPPPRPCGHSKVGCDFLVGQSITQKMETPVLYFHSGIPRKVSIDIGFPKGIISQTYPAPILSLPLPIPGVSLTNGFVHFDIDVLTWTKHSPPEVEQGNIYAHARNVDANLIISNEEVEKFIFYRGLGNFETKLFITSKNGNITVKNIGNKKISQAFLVDTNEFGGAILPLGSFAGKTTKYISDKKIQLLKDQHQEFKLFAESAKIQLTKSLVASGLYQDEAIAMVNTWEHGYFRTPGLRVLYILDQNEVENILPMAITPAPQELNRVFVGRIEVLRDLEENEILAQILRERSSFNVLALGRFAPSIMNRIYQLAQERKELNPELQTLFDQFFLTIAEKL